MKKLLIIVLLVLTVGGGYVFWVQGRDRGGDYSSALPHLVSQGSLIVGTDPTYPPMEDVDEDGEMFGFDIDLAQAIADRLGVELDMKYVVWDDLFDEMSDGELDLAISSVSITSERGKTMLFSNPYLNAGQVVIALDGSDIVEVEDIRDQKIGAYYETTSEEEAKKFSDTVIAYEETSNIAVERLLAGEFDAIVVDFTAGAEMARSHENVVMVGEPFTSEFYGIATRLGNDEFVSVVNLILADMKADGSLGELENKWFRN